MPDLETLKQKLAAARQEVRNLTVMAMNPKHPPEKAELLRYAERSARAEVRLRQKALQHAQGQQ
jgi:hypothetical protein